MSTRPSDVGILALQLYTPATYVDQSELETFDGVSSGKYTIGLGQLKMAAFSDREDVVSQALTVVSLLFKRNNISPTSIGRLEVATESSFDKSKAVKTFLMDLFTSHGNHDVEGVDNVNACYAGTACLFNTCAWIESSSWDGRFGLVVCSDVAVYATGNARPAGGGGAVAMLVGPNAPLVLEPGLRSSYFAHAYDFYKPNPASEYPVVDGILSTTSYTTALDHCWLSLASKYKAKTGEEMRLSSFKHVCFHSPYNKLVRKSFARLAYHDHKTGNDEAIDGQYRQLSKEDETTQADDIAKYFMQTAAGKYTDMVGNAAEVGVQIGNMYTASLYGGLVGLVASRMDAQLEGSRVLMFSYGSGIAASLFVLRVAGSTQAIREAINLDHVLSSRIKVSPAQFTEMLACREQLHGKSGLSARWGVENIREGTFYLDSIDDKFRRKYLVKQ